MHGEDLNNRLGLIRDVLAIRIRNGCGLGGVVAGYGRLAVSEHGLHRVSDEVRRKRRALMEGKPG